ncbi:hypothetical protein B0H34DRAFT_715561 [Crassisporium funariophilum]|nr:hypothetical protein B0H34DRAFT_715561 [Crassisporium funariophilum]
MRTLRPTANYDHSPPSPFLPTPATTRTPLPQALQPKQPHSALTTQSPLKPHSPRNPRKPHSPRNPRSLETHQSLSPSKPRMSCRPSRCERAVVIGSWWGVSDVDGAWRRLWWEGGAVRFCPPLLFSAFCAVLYPSGCALLCSLRVSKRVSLLYFFPPCPLFVGLSITFFNLPPLL